MDKRAEILRNLMNENGVKVSDIVKISGLPYSTVKAILERGAGKAGYVNVCKICHALGISTDDLEKMVSDISYRPDTVAAHNDGENFTDDELEKIEEYKKLLVAARPKE